MRVADWMHETRESQGTKLRALVQTYTESVNQ